MDKIIVQIRGKRYFLLIFGIGGIIGLLIDFLFNEIIGKENFEGSLYKLLDFANDQYISSIRASSIAVVKFNQAPSEIQLCQIYHYQKYLY